jgi:cytolysin-activating lysine-acyltransferase
VIKAAAGSDKNGSAGRQAAPAPKSVPPRDLRQARFALTFSQVVSVLMRDPNFRKLRLADLEWLVIPPIMSGQFRLAQAPMQPPGAKAPGSGKQGQESAKAAQGGAFLVPVAVALWASVSANIDKALSGNLDKQVRLHPAEWASGDNLWLMAVAGDQRALPTFLKRLRDEEFKGKQVKMRMRGPDGKMVVKTIARAS